MKRLVVVAVAVLCCAAFAEGPKGGPHPEGGRRGGGPREGMSSMIGGKDPIVRVVTDPAVAEKLGLSDEQKAKLKELCRPSKKDRETQKKVREAAMKQVELMKADKIDETAVMAAIDVVFELRKDMAKEQAKRVIEVKSVLTPEQVVKVHEEVKKMLEPRGDRGPRRPDARDGKGRRRDGKGPRGEKGPKEGPKEGCDEPVPPPEAK